MAGSAEPRGLCTLLQRSQHQRSLGPRVIHLGAVPPTSLGGRECERSLGLFRSFLKLELIGKIVTELSNEGKRLGRGVFFVVFFKLHPLVVAVVFDLFIVL